MARILTGLRKMVLLGIALSIFVLWCGVFTHLFKPRPRTIIRNAGLTFAWSPDGEFLFTSAHERPPTGSRHRYGNDMQEDNLQLWNTSDGSIAFSPTMDKLGRFFQIEFSPTGQHAFLMFESGGELWHLGERRRLAAVRCRDYLCACRFSPDGHKLAVLAEPRPIQRGFLTPMELQVFDLKTEKVIVRAEGVSPMEFTPDSRHLLVGNNSRRVAFAFDIIEVSTGARLGGGLVPGSSFRSIARVTPDLSRLLATSNEFPNLGDLKSIIRIYDTATLQVHAQVDCEPASVHKFVQPGWDAQGLMGIFLRSPNGVFLPVPGAKEQFLLVDVCRDDCISLHISATRMDVSEDARLALLMENDSATIIRVPSLEVQTALHIPSLDVREQRALVPVVTGRWYLSKTEFVPHQPLLLLETEQEWEEPPPLTFMDQINLWLNPAFGPMPESGKEPPIGTVLPLPPGAGPPARRPVFIAPTKMEKKLRLFNTTTGANLLVFPPGDSWSVCPNGKYLAVARGNDIQIWDLPPRRPAPLIVVLAVLHTALILGPCWYFARHRATEAAE